MTAHCRRPIALTALIVAFLTVGAAYLHADVPVVLTRVGNPIWRPTDFHLFTAPCEPTPDAFNAVADLLVPFPEPRTDPPYDNLLSVRMAAAGFQDATIFLPADIDGEPSGIYFAHMLIPDPGETGSSPDFASGPIIPNRLFPIFDDTDILRNGIVMDGELDGPFSPSAGFAGKSHDAAIFCDDAVFFPPGTELTGNWAYRSVLRDAAGNGWDISAPFQVVPEPSSLALALVLLLCATAAAQAANSSLVRNTTEWSDARCTH